MSEKGIHPWEDKVSILLAPSLVEGDTRGIPIISSYRA